MPRTHLPTRRRVGCPSSHLLGAAQQRRHVRHLCCGGYPLPQVAYSTGVDRVLALGDHEKRGGDVRAGRLLQLRSRRESALSGGDESMDRGRDLEETRPRY